MKFITFFLGVLGALIVSFPFLMSEHIVDIASFPQLKELSISTYFVPITLAMGGIILSLSMFFLVILLLRHSKFRRLQKEFWIIAGNGNGLEFEAFLIKMFKLCGWKVSTPTSSTYVSDRGVDLILNGKIAVQAKNYKDSNVTGNQAIHDIYSGMAYWKKNGFPRLKKAAVITTSSFTRQAKEEAQTLGITLKDKKDIEKLLNAKPSKNWILKR